MERHPVCGMKVDKNASVERRAYNGETYYFCSLRCKELFDGNPEKFSKKYQKGLKNNAQ